MALTPPIEELLADVRARVDLALDQALRPRPGRPPKLVQAMRYAVLGGGKRFRPAVCMLATRALGRDPRRAVLPATALEMIHAYALIHDDLPCMDDAVERRGRPCTHVQFGEAMGVLAGDALLTEAFGLLAGDDGAAPLLSAATRIRCLGTLVRAAGVGGMAGGQAMDIDPDHHLSTVDDVEMLHAAKTGSLFEAAAELGALVADADPWQVQALWAYGSSLGALFQVTDDLLDWKGDETPEGERRASLVARIGPLATHERAQRLYDQAVEALKDIPGTAYLEALASAVLRRRA